MKDADTLLSEIGIMITFMSANISCATMPPPSITVPTRSQPLQVPMYLTAALKAPRK